MNKTRLEAFSDGVLAIIITIMVLEMKVPHEGSIAALYQLLPVFISYVLSFIYVGVYWGNHHHLLHAVHKINPGIMWANLNLLFWLSLLPFATGWMGENHFQSVPVAIYAVLLNVCGIAYTILQVIILRTQTLNAAMVIALKKQTYKGYLSVIGYGLAIPFAFFYVPISIGLFFAVAIIWLVPDKNIEKSLETERQTA